MNKEKVKKHLETIELETKEALKEFASAPPPPPPPPPPETEALKFFDLDALGIYMDILENAWDPKTEEETFDRIRQFLIKVCSIAHPRGISRFTTIHSGKPEHAHLNFKTPWIWEGKKINFKKPNERFWHLNKRYLEILKELNIRDIPQAFLREYYSSFFNKNQNVNGVKGFFSQESLWVEKWYVWRLLIEQKRLEMQTGIKFFNEVGHNNDARYHWIANRHRDLYEHLKEKDLLELKDLIADTSMSEASRAQLVYHGKTNVCMNCGNRWQEIILEKPRCPKCGSKDVDRNYVCAKCQKYFWDNLPQYGRDCMAEKHQTGIFEDLEIGHKSFNGFMISANPLAKGSEDGSQNEDAKIVPIIGLKWRIGTPDQVSRMLDYTWKRCSDSNREKGWIWGLLHIGQFSLLDKVIKSYFHPDLPAVYWERLDAVGQKHREIWKGEG